MLNSGYWMFEKVSGFSRAGMRELRDSKKVQGKKNRRISNSELQISKEGIPSSIIQFSIFISHSREGFS
jgi:hypothetical protein